MSCYHIEKRNWPSAYNPPFYPRIKGKIGLFGGSFNPTHDGHVYVSQQAIKRLGLDQLWWLVSPCNPLKNKAELLGDSERLSQAQLSTKKNPAIKITLLEQLFGCNYTVETLKNIKKIYPQTTFYWIMGADNLACFAQWHRWQEIAELAHIIVVDRGKFKYKAFFSKPSSFMRRKQQKNPKNSQISFLSVKKHPASATAIRKYWNLLKKPI